MTASEIITTIKDVVMIFAAGIASYVAWAGLKTWRKQLTGTTEYELARSLLKAVYTLRDAIYNFRTPIKQPKSEVNVAGQRVLGDPDYAWEIDFLDPAFEERTLDYKWSVVREALTGFEGVSTEAKVLWKDEVKGVFDGIHSYVTYLYGNYMLYIDALRKMGDIPIPFGDHDTRDMDRMYRYYERIFGTHGKKDQSTPEMEALIKDLEDCLEPYLKK